MSDVAARTSSVQLRAYDLEDVAGLTPGIFGVAIFDTVNDLSFESIDDLLQDVFSPDLETRDEVPQVALLAQASPDHSRIDERGLNRLLSSCLYIASKPRLIAPIITPRAWKSRSTLASAMAIVRATERLRDVPSPTP